MDPMTKKDLLAITVIIIVVGMSVVFVLQSGDLIQKNAQLENRVRNLEMSYLSHVQEYKANMQAIEQVFRRGQTQPTAKVEGK